jgi:fatty acid desaturase
MNILSYIDKQELRAFTTANNWRAAYVVVVNVALVAAGFALPAIWHHPVAWILASILLAGRTLGFAILMHDTAHLSFFTSRSVNQWMGKWIFGALPNVPYAAYRRGHLEHHRAAGTDADPDLAFVSGYPATRASLARKFLRDVCGINGIKGIIYQFQPTDRGALYPFWVMHGLIVAALWSLGVPEVYACWWLGQLFVFPLLLRLRVMGEHGGVPDHMDRDPRRYIATTLAGPLARLLVAPNFVNYHVEHHIAATVPGYKLPSLHKLLRERDYFEGATCLSPSFWAVVRRCTATNESAAKRRKSGVRGALDNMR